jgi:hypothetical protein
MASKAIFSIQKTHNFLVHGFHTTWSIIRATAYFTAKVVRQGRYVIFQMVLVAVPKELFQEILRLIAELRQQPPPAPA